MEITMKEIQTRHLHARARFKSTEIGKFSNSCKIITSFPFTTMKKKVKYSYKNSNSSGKEALAGNGPKTTPFCVEYGSNLLRLGEVDLRVWVNDACHDLFTKMPPTLVHSLFLYSTQKYQNNEYVNYMHRE